jgi:hypothetical protein
MRLRIAFTLALELYCGPLDTFLEISSSVLCQKFR